MGIISASFKVASNLNDKLPFTPNSKTLYDTATKYDLLKLIPEYPIDSGDVNSTSNESLTLIEKVNNTIGYHNGKVNGNTKANTRKIKEKLILNRRVKTAINDEDEHFSTLNILSHDNNSRKILISTPTSDSDDFIYENDYESNDDYGHGNLQDALDYLEKAFYNERVHNDDELFGSFFNESMCSIFNKVYEENPRFNFLQLFDSLDKNLKFTILENYLNDDRLIQDFKMDFYLRHRQIQSIKNVTTKDESIEKHPAITASHKTKPYQEKYSSSYTIDSLIFKFVQLTISIWFLSLKTLFHIGFPVMELIWIRFLEVNSKYNIVARLNNLIVSVLTLIVDQLFQLIDGSEMGLFADTMRGTGRGTTATAMGDPTQRSYLDWARVLASYQISNFMSASTDNKDE